MANPILSRVELSVSSNAMTVSGVVKKTSILLATSAATGIAFFFYVLLAGQSGIIFPALMGSVIATMGLGLYLAFNPIKAKTLAVPYAILEGILIGAFSLYAIRFSPSIPVIALSATFVTAAVMLGLYRSGMIKVTDKFRSVVSSAVMAIFIVYALQWVLSLAFGSSLPFLFDGGMIAIGFSLFVIAIASFFLLLDFDNVERGVAASVSEDYEWIYSIGLLATLVWMYIEFVRLLSYFND